MNDLDDESLQEIMFSWCFNSAMDLYIVQAEYSFKGENNDELCFKKGDIITVTQREDGGWWEGTFGDKTGWFPSNYVKEYKAPLPAAETLRPPEEIQAYRSVVLTDLLDSERAHVAEVRGLLENFLEPLSSSQILNPDEYAQLMCNFVEVVQTHEELLQAIEDCNDRVGKLFLSKASLMKSVHQAYCAAHPRAIVILDKYKDELETFMERQGAATPGLLVLTTGLSKPFRRLDKYSAMLQELERHMESGHPDRGDTQRSIAVYKDIATTCSDTRRQKELELQVLTGPVRGWQGQDLTTLGDIIHMGSVAVGPDHRDRYFVLFPQTLLILSVSQRMSAFIYEGKLPLTGIHVTRLDDTDTIKNAFEVSGPLIEKIVAVCQGPNEANKWVDLLSTNPSATRRTTGSIDLKRNISSSAVNIPQPPPHMSSPVQGSSHPNRSTTPVLMPQHKRSLSFNHHLSYNQFHNHQSNSSVTNNKHQLNQMHPTLEKIGGHLAVGGKSINSTKANWSIMNLRPAPPLRPSLTNSCGGSNSAGALSSYSKTKSQPTYEEDALVLRVIEAYCAAYQNTSRNTMHSVLQPWTPCLPIRGGKLKTSKYYSTSNPQLPFMCSSGSFVNSSRNNSSSSLNSSYIWREAAPNNFNMYSASVSSLNTSYRYSLGQNTGSPEWRGVMSEDKSSKRSFISQLKNKTISNYENVYMTPLLPARKNKQPTQIVKVWKHPSSCSTTTTAGQHRVRSDSPTPQPHSGNHAVGIGLYDRRINRSFEAPSPPELKVGPLRRSTPHLACDSTHPDSASSRHSATWCCGNFVMKQWRKMNNYD